jgi:hypothetical protein
VTHLASAITFQFHQNKWVVFVTTDQNEILARQNELSEMFLKCSSPNWAEDYYIDLTKNKAPKTWVQELTNPSSKQIQIISVFKK